MVKLTDLAPVTKKVTLRGHEFDVSGISAMDLAEIAVRFPDEAKKLLEAESVTPHQVLALARPAAGAILAACLGSLGDAGEEKAALGLPAGEQIEILEAGIKLTMPEGVVPFVERLVSIFQALQFQPAKAAAIKSSISAAPSKN